MNILEITLNPTYCNHWPYFFVVHNNQLVYESEIIKRDTIELSLPDNATENTITLGMKGKQFGEQGIWDTQVDDTGSIIEDCTLAVEDILLEEVSIHDLLIKQPYMLDATPGQQHMGREVISDGTMNFNGAFTIHYQQPVLNSIIDQKHKIPLDSSKSYFSNFSTRFHYGKDEAIIAEIYEILNEAEKLSDKPSSSGASPSAN